MLWVDPFGLPHGGGEWFGAGQLAFEFGRQIGLDSDWVDVCCTAPPV